MLKFKRKGLNPFKITLIYLLVLLFCVIHQADRLADWLTDPGSGNGPSTFALNLAADIKKLSKLSGLSALIVAENNLIDFLTPTITLGTKAKPLIAVSTAKKTDSISVNLSPIPPLAPLATSDPAPTPAPTEEIVLVPARTANNLLPVFQKILLTGDSMMLEGLGPPLQKALSDLEVTVTREGRYATGLCRLDVFDWYVFFDGLLSRHQPDLVIITLGANDTQDIVDDSNHRHHVATESWNEVYSERVKHLLLQAETKGVEVFWIGLPIMGREPYNTRAENINQVVSKVCLEAVNCHFWDAWKSLADKNVKYTTFATVDGKHVRLRAKDSIHLTELGGKLMTDQFLAVATGWARLGSASPLMAKNTSLSVTDAIAPLVDPKAQDLGKSSSETPGQPSGTPKDTTEQIQAKPEPDSLSTKSPSADNLDNPIKDSLKNKKQIDSEFVSEGPATLTEVLLDSKFRGKTTKYLVYSPKTSQPRPAVFLLHGAEDNFAVWQEKAGPALLALAERYNLNLIMPDGDPFGWYLDSPVKNNSRIMSYFMEELIPDVINRFPVDQNRLGLLGISMGGHGALTLALKNPGRFKAVSSLSGVTDLTSHTDKTTLNRFLKLDTVLGSYQSNSQRWRDNSAYWLTRHQPELLKPLALKLTVGLSDKLTLAENRQYHRLLTDLGLEHEYLEDSGNHGWGHWLRHIPEHLAFQAEHL